MPTDINVSQLIINKLTQAQFDEAKAEGNISDSELYLITDSTNSSEGSVSIDIDTELSNTSENPVQNKIITNALNNKLDLTGGLITSTFQLSDPADSIEYIYYSENDNRSYIRWGDSGLPLTAAELYAKTITIGSSPSEDLVYINGTVEVDGILTATEVHGAVWNDYAEFRISNITEPGRVICEYGDDTLILANERLQPGANVISDTYGFAIGETNEAKTPVAVSGRVLAYPYEDRNTYKPGDAVCAAPEGTVSKMSREEIMTYPERIIGTVSAIPSYNTWGEKNVPVNGRIWIKVR